VPIPRVVIVGRPNVGKSSLLNMIAGAKVSIVDPTPGVTRDRVSAIVDLPAPDGKRPARTVEFIDTGGFGVYVAEGARFDEVGHDLARLTDEIEGQIRNAISTADLVLFCVDTQRGLTAHDERIATMLREQKLGVTERPGATPARGKKKTGGASKKKGSKAATRITPTVPIRVVATKVDGPKWETHAMELAGLGFGEPLACSAKNNYMRRDLIDAIYELVPDAEEPAEDLRADLRLAIIGKRNAGKSTLVNTLAGEERMIVSEIPGTTRDSVDVRMELEDGRTVVAIDTAGLRRKKSFQGAVEWYAFDRLERSVRRCDVVLLLVDATTKISQVDEHLAQLANASGKPGIVVVNKWDLVEGRPGPKGRPATPEDYEEYLREELKGMAISPVSFMSGKTGLNVPETIELAFELHEQAGRRVTTGKLNRLLREILARRGPPSKLGTIAKLYFAAQVATHPPTIAIVVNKPELFTPNYQRFLVNRIREAAGFDEVPVRLLVRGRKPGESWTEESSAEPLIDEARSGKLAPMPAQDEVLAEFKDMAPAEFFDE
jgi:GTP-binding protein